MPEVRMRRVRRVEPPPDGAKVISTVLMLVLITVLFVAAVLTLRGVFTAIVIVAYLLWVWFALRRLRARRRR